MKVILSPLFTHYFAGRIWMGMDVELIKNELEKQGCEVIVTPFSKLAKQEVSFFEDAVLFYSSIYNPEYLQYMKDTITYLSRKHPSVTIWPSIDMLYSLENKGYQEYLKDLLGITALNGKYYGDFTDFDEDEQPLSFPFVWKKNEGALSSGVKLAKSSEEIEDLKAEFGKRNIKDKLAFEWNKYRSFNMDQNLEALPHLLKENFNDFFAKRTPFVTQQFIPDLGFDYKVLTFGDRIFVLKRGTRENDFRASGSGKFQWVEPEDLLLQYVEELRAKFNHPFLSLDIGEDEAKNYYLFEFQGTAFGPLTAIGAEYFYVGSEEGFKRQENNYSLEQHYAYSIVYRLTGQTSSTI